MNILPNDVVTMIYKFIHREFTNVLITQYNELYKYKVLKSYNWRIIDQHKENRYYYIYKVSKYLIKCYVSLPERYKYSSGKHKCKGFY